jgi:hypothetical protein
MMQQVGMVIWGTLEGSALFAVAIAFVGIPLWLVTAGIIRVADVLSKDRVARVAAVPEQAQARVTRFGRPAKLAVFALIADSVLCLALGGGWYLFFSRTQMPDPLAILMVALVGLGSLLTTAIGALLVAIVADMFIAHRVAGRDTKIACGIVGALCALQTAAYFGVAVFSGR